MQAHSCLRFLVFLGFYVFLFVLLRPVRYVSLVSLLLVNIDVLMKRLFMLADDGASGMFFVNSAVKLVLLFYFGV